MLGAYSDFPTKIHGIARYSYQTSTQQLQNTIVHTLYQLNQKTIELRKLTISSPSNCALNFEFGIAEHYAFNFLDKEELEKFQKSQNQSVEPMRLLDFFCALRYCTMTDEGRRRSLKFDYILLRFVFQMRAMEIFIVHERGPQRVPLEDLVTFLTNRINNGLKQNGLKTLALKYLHAL